MTQALNLALLANNVNSSGQLNGATGIYGTIPVTNLPTVTTAYGGTGTTATPSNGQIHIGNGTGFALATLTAGTGMSITNGSGSITLNSSSLPGVLGQVFTSSGTFTIPSGVTAVKVTVVGAGGGSAGYSGCTTNNGSSGGTTSVASGTQTISTISATGGGGGTGGVVSGGSASGCDIVYGTAGAANGAGQSATIFAPGNSRTNAVSPNTGQGTNTSGGGGSGIKYLSGLTSGNTLTVTIGTGGAGGGGSPAGVAGANGIVVFEW